MRGGVEAVVVGRVERGTPRREAKLQEWEVELQHEGEKMWKGIHKFKMRREGKASTCNLLNAKWVLTEEGTHGRRVKHGLEGSGLGSSTHFVRDTTDGENERVSCARGLANRGCLHLPSQHGIAPLKGVLSLVHLKSSLIP